MTAFRQPTNLIATGDVQHSTFMEDACAFSTRTSDIVSYSHFCLGKIFLPFFLSNPFYQYPEQFIADLSHLSVLVYRDSFY